jgi:hypothetical protein
MCVVTLNGSELRLAGWVSSFCSISVVYYASRDERFGLLPRQKKHTDDQLGHIYSIMLNQRHVYSTIVASVS